MFDYGVELGIDRVRVALINVTHYILYGFGELMQARKSTLKLRTVELL
jgi:hypothetical protein